MPETMQARLRGLPSVEELVATLGGRSLVDRYGRDQTVRAVRAVLDIRRSAILAGEDGPDAVTLQKADLIHLLLHQAGGLLYSWSQSGLRRVLNLSGVIIHTNLGRARLAPAAVAKVVQVAESYSDLEYDLEAGARGHRETHVESLLTRLTGAEAAFVVNNNAGAVLLLLMALAAGREVLVSRGQLVEIGGSFRLPDIMRAGGVKLVEVGTTNRTRIRDFETAVTSESALLMRVHTSNYRIVGFTEEPGLGELVELGRRQGIPVADDLGSGALLDLDVFGREPTVTASLEAGADVVCFSGDKLLGGPQAGILVGRTEVLARLRTHPAARALRPDKMTLAALEATLQLYLNPARARREIPTLRLLERGTAETCALAERLGREIEQRCAVGLIIDVEKTTGRAGGGSMPLVELPSHAVRVRIPGQGCSQERPRLVGVADLEAELRRAPVPVIARVSLDSIFLDVLALDETEVSDAAQSFAWAAGRLMAPPDPISAAPVPPKPGGAGVPPEQAASQATS